MLWGITISCWQFTYDLPTFSAANGCFKEILSVSVLYGCSLGTRLMVVLSVWEQPRIELVPLECYEFIMWFSGSFQNIFIQQGPQTFLWALFRDDGKLFRVWEGHRSEY